MTESLRSRLNSYPVIAIGLIAVCVVVAIVSFSLNMRSPAIQPKSFYTTDDGASYFGLDEAPAAPFPYEGGTAVHANIYKGSNGKSFVGFMDKYSDEAKTAMNKAGVRFQQMGMNALSEPEQEAVKKGFLVKKPGEKKWKPNGSASYEIIMYARGLKAPDGSDATPILPND